MKPPSQRGRGAADNPRNRYFVQYSAPFDDGWAQEEAVPLRTDVAIDRPRRAISYNTSPDIPFDRSINPYRGCEHGCVYCYARPTHAYLDLSPGLDFESRLFARPDIVALLREELAAPGYRPAPLALGAVTDAYQPIERAHRLTRTILETLLETRHPVILVTKSAMIERDIDLLVELAARQLVEVAVSVTTLDRSLARILEPRAAAPQRRLQVIETLSAAGIPVRAMLAPLIPVLNEPEIEAILRAARRRLSSRNAWSSARNRPTRSTAPATRSPWVLASCTSQAEAGAIPPAPPPMLTRSLPNVALATVQPALGSPTTSSSGTKTSLKKTSLNSFPPVIWRSGRTSTPGAFISTITIVMPACLGTSKSVRTVANPRRA